MMPDRQINSWNMDYSGGYHHIWLKLYYRTVMIKMILFWHDSHIGQWTRIKDWDISSHFPQLTDFFFYKKIVKTYELDKRTHLQLIVLGSLNLIIHEN